MISLEKVFIIYFVAVSSAIIAVASIFDLDVTTTVNPGPKATELFFGVKPSSE